MKCKYCKEKDDSRLMMRSQVVNGIVETNNICLNCWWTKEINTDVENENSLSKQKPNKGRIPDQPESSHPEVGKAVG